MLYGAGTDYCLFLISRYREELTAAASVRPALAESVGAVGGALAASAGTVICRPGHDGFRRVRQGALRRPGDRARPGCRAGRVADADAGAVAAARPGRLLAAAPGRRDSEPTRQARLPPSPALPFGNRGSAEATPSRDGIWDCISRVVVARPVTGLPRRLAVLVPFALLGLRVTPAFKPTGELSPTVEQRAGTGRRSSSTSPPARSGRSRCCSTRTTDWNERAEAQRDRPSQTAASPARQRRRGPQPDAAAGQAVAGPRVRPGRAERGEPLPAQRRRRNSAACSRRRSKKPASIYVAKIETPAGPEYVTRLDVVLQADPFEPAQRGDARSCADAGCATQLPRGRRSARAASATASRSTPATWRR